MRFLKNCHSGDGDCGPQGRAARICRFGGHVLLGVVVVVAVATVIGWVVMAAWNAVVPAVFNLPQLGFWQAVALLVLARVLTGRLHHHRGGRRGGGKCKLTRCFTKGGEESEDGLPPHPDNFAQWWWEEGEPSFRAFQVRLAGSPPDGRQV